MPRLTARQARFVEEYLVDLNATQAAIRAGYSAKRADVIITMVPDTPHVQDVLFGVRAARKGWLTRRDVINCLPLGQVEAALEAKRARFT